MTRARTSFPSCFRLLVLLAALAGSAAALADEYGDINLLLRSGRTAEALAKADQFLANNPREPRMRFLKGIIQTEAGRTADATATFARLTEDFPALPEPYNNLAVLYAAQGQYDKARTTLEMAIRTNPAYATAHENLGDVYAKLASQAYSKALQLDSSNTGAQPKLAMIRELSSARDSRIGTPVTVAAAAPVAPPAPAATPSAAAPAPAATPSPPVSRTAPTPPPGAAPIAPARPATPAAADLAEKEVEHAVHAWAAAWSGKDVRRYLGAYGSEFDPPGKQSRRAWEEERRARILGKSRISVRISDLAVSVHGNRATTRFKQAYSADALNVSSRKTLEWAKSGGRWVIVREHTGS